MGEIFTDLVVNGLLQFGQAQGAVSARGLLMAPGNSAPAALVTGNNNNVVLPNFGFPGATAFYFGTVASGANLTGIAPPTDVVAREGQMIAVVNLGANAITTVANSSASLAANRISAAVVIVAGTGCLFIYTGSVWVPLTQTTGS